MDIVLTMSFRLMADSSDAIAVMRGYVTPTMQVLTALAALASVFFVTWSGFLYMGSQGDPEKLGQAKRLLKNALVGLVIVLGAGTLTAILSSSIGHAPDPSSAVLPTLQAVTPDDPGNGLVEIIIKAVTGLLNNIIQTVAAPFLAALGFFTKGTPLMTDNGAVFNLWLAMVGITDALFVVIVALLGFHVMSASAFGLDELDFRQLLPRIAFIFLLLNTGIFLIDGIIALSNTLITAVGAVGGSSSVWETLTKVVKESGGQSVAALLVMLVFMVFAVILLVYYVGRLVALFVGTVLSPLVFLVWLIPGFRDFSETAMKTYVTTIFTLFVHVVILQLAASLFTGMSAASSSGMPDTLMAMVLGLATVIALLKTQGLMMQFSYVSLGARSTRQLGTTFMNGVGYLSGKNRGAATAASGRTTASAAAPRPQAMPLPRSSVARPAPVPAASQQNPQKPRSPQPVYRASDSLPTARAAAKAAANHRKEKP